MLSLLTFLIVDNTEILTRLQKELHTVMPRPDSQPKWNQLEQLPYLVSPFKLFDIRPFSHTYAWFSDRSIDCDHSRGAKVDECSLEHSKLGER